MRYATTAHWATIIGDVDYCTPHGEFKIEYQGPRGEYTTSDLDKLPEQWRECGWKVDIGQYPMDSSAGTCLCIITPFLGSESIHSDWFTLSFTRGSVRMSADFDKID